MILSVVALSIAACVPEPEVMHTGATGLPWYVKSEEVRLGKTSYAKFGMPRIFLPADIELLTPHRGGFFYKERGHRRGDVIYLLTWLESCEFQPYKIVE